VAAGQYPPAAGRLAEMMATARLDQALAARLLALPRAARRQAIESDATLRRWTLARLLRLTAEAALEDATAEAEELAELAAAIAAALPRDAGGKVRRTAAVASWLLGKALLRSAAPRQSPPASLEVAAGTPATPAPAAVWLEQPPDAARLVAAEQAFGQISAFISTARPSRERGLCCVGLAEVRWRQGRLFEAGALLALGAQIFARAHRAQQAAACHVLHGFLLLGSGDLMLARLELRKAERLLETPLAPSLAALAAIGLACCEAGTGAVEEVGRRLDRAQRLMGLVPEPLRTLPRAWRELLAAWEAARATASPAPPAMSATSPTSAGAAEARAGGAPPPDPVLLGLLAGSPWRDAYPEELVLLADRLLLDRAEDEAPLGAASGA
jgi:hypothetical protein